jgi:hypothetical protein
MNMRSIFSSALSAALVLAFLGCSSGNHGNNPPQNNVPEPLERVVKNLTQDLERHNFEVKRGYFRQFTIDDCQWPIAVMGNCFANNPVAPYIVYFVPHWPEEYVDPNLVNMLGPPAPGFINVFRFDPKEAIIILAQLPPPGAYFGLQHYEFSRPGIINTQDPIYLWLGTFSQEVQKLFFDYCPDPTRLRIFASINNSNNNVVVERQSGASFGQLRYFITTPDQYMARSMTQYLRDAGVPDTRHIFIEPVPGTLRVGLDKSADDFDFLMRYALPANKTEGDAWRANPPMTVLRVRDLDRHRAPEPYPPPALDPRLGNDEHPLQPDLNNLALALKKFWDQPTAPPVMTFDSQTQVDMVGPDCEVRGMNCLADDLDTSYLGSMDIGLDNNEVYAVMSTLATETGNATYVNISIYDAALFKGVASIDNDRIQDSAEEFCQVADCTGVNNIEKLYLFYITRDCQSLGLSNCFSIDEDQIPVGKTIKIVQRSYIKPGTARGADSTKLLLPVIIKLDGSKM